MGCLENLHRCKAACCTTLSFPVPQLSPEQIDYYEKRGCTVTRRTKLDQSGHVRIKYAITVYSPCQQLTQDGQCRLHGSPEKPMICTRFGDGPGQTTKGYLIPRQCIYHPDFIADAEE